jgi:hypothetical protein
MNSFKLVKGEGVRLDSEFVVELAKLCHSDFVQSGAECRVMEVPGLGIVGHAEKIDGKVWVGIFQIEEYRRLKPTNLLFGWIRDIVVALRWDQHSCPITCRPRDTA